MRQKLALLFVLTMILIISPVSIVAAAYSDIPTGSWASSTIASATDYGLISGVGDGSFGYGKEVSRAEFVTMVCRMFGWELIAPASPSFTDVSQSSWYYTYVETALAHNVMDGGGSFVPQASITRSDMAVMLVRALGYEHVATEASKYNIPFTDVTAQKGYIAVAYDIGMISGTSTATFSPNNTAKREEAAAMLVRVYEKYMGKTDFLHGFYAFSSYSQRYVTDYMDAVSFGWSKMCFDQEKGVWLNTGSENSNQWSVPDSYEYITAYLEGNGVKSHLNVFMDTSDNLKEMLLAEETRAAAVKAIINEVSRKYDAIGKNPYGGVTIDFEGLKGNDSKAGFTAFLTLLSSELKSRGLTLYVAVPPALADGVYYDGYDYQAIGNLADKVILMAHDYNTATLDDFIGTQWHKTTALTPISSVYYSLRAITDKETGIEDKSKIVLAISFSTIGWEITEDGKVKSGTAFAPALSTVYQRLLQKDTITDWSSQYKNPYMTYYTESGQKIFLWYENAESVAEKIKLAKLFGINGVSFWRIGIIPDYSGVYDVWSTVSK